jgi:putative transposase
LVEITHPELSIARQCQLLSVARSSFYYQAQPVSEEELSVMRLIDQQFMETPFYGSRKMSVILRNQGYVVNRKRVQRLMQQMGLVAIYPQPNTSKPHPEHRIYPYLLRGVAVTGANQVWCTDITYLPMSKGHFYLVALMGWFSRKVLSWRISNSLDVDFCIDALEESLSNYKAPGIFNSDQGAQFTANAFTGCLKTAGVQISMDGRGRCHDNIFIEWLWRSLKYELIYIKAFENGQELTKEVRQWFNWYNQTRSHQGLSYSSLNQVYCDSLKKNGLDHDEELILDQKSERI